MNGIKFDKSWLIFIAAAAVFLAIKVFAADYAVSDENTYFKMGQLVAQGQVPYRDFFFSHTPLQIYIYAVIFKVFGFNFLLLKILSAAAIAITAAFIFAIIKERLNFNIAAAASVVFLFSYGTLLFSNFPTGADFAIAFMAAAFYFFMRKSFLASGILSGLAAATAQLSLLLFIILAAAAAFILKDRKAAARLMLGFAIAFGPVSLVFLAAAKGEFIRQILTYHLNKPGEEVDKAAIFLRIVKTNWLLFIAAAAAAVSKYRVRISVLLPLALAGAYIAAFPLIKSSFNYYVLYAFPFLAIAGGYGLFSAYELLAERLKLRRGVAAAAIAAIIVLASFSAARQFSSYDFQDFPIAGEAAAYVRENTQEGQTIFGDDSTTPLISLLSRREIALNYVDNNAMRYRSGITDLGTTIQLLQEAISRKELKLVLLRRIKVQEGAYVDFGIGTEDRFMAFVKENCRLAKEFQYEWKDLTQQLEVYECLPVLTTA
ncbi:glycosyltransferase family 39 protein [Candidatus Woesearchaeota archaeon]|nr:glycosyltransferase family 39 protein [Candidatus Woesearchaeota archaeon]